MCHIGNGKKQNKDLETVEFKKNNEMNKNRMLDVTFQVFKRVPTCLKGFYRLIDQGWRLKWFDNQNP